MYSKKDYVSLEGKVEAVQNDVKELFFMLAKMHNAKPSEKKFMKL